MSQIEGVQLQHSLQLCGFMLESLLIRVRRMRVQLVMDGLGLSHRRHKPLQQRLPVAAL